jgi:hypothetical protein
MSNKTDKDNNQNTGASENNNSAPANAGADKKVKPFKIKSIHAGRLILGHLHLAPNAELQLTDEDVKVDDTMKRINHAANGKNPLIKIIK